MIYPDPVRAAQVHGWASRCADPARRKYLRSLSRALRRGTWDHRIDLDSERWAYVALGFLVALTFLF